MVDRNELKKLMNNHRQKQDHKAVEPSKTKIFLERKQVRDITNKQETQKKSPKSSQSDELCTTRLSC